MSFHKIKLLLKPPSFQNVVLTTLEFISENLCKNPYALCFVITDNFYRKLRLIVLAFLKKLYCAL